MGKFLLSLHVLAAVIAIGPVTVAASMFPRKARAALAGGPEAAGEASAVHTLNRITKVYAAIGVAVPVLGIGTAQVMGVMSSPWLITSLVLTIVAALVLLVLVLPPQQAVVDTLAGEAEADAGKALGGLKMLAMSTGLFSLLWAVVTVLMVVRPGSTTHA
ncbi:MULTISPECIES: DUF2269 family protein [Kitasatospora]|uniref:DUF2269 family protein n=1 Tax=Kitasatospora acidiphila TaxID=2567942 RepID=A0A540W9F6_9ACTN|nr:MULTISPECIES: DUF2269 family protein [Kitasatospora]MDH6138943.1 preprotein translocase subunit SecG [Kitasatospora sp. GP30]TQF05645.1 DUF2269 family protein [Kitasatospora acidiphila]